VPCPNGTNPPQSCQTAAPLLGWCDSARLASDRGGGKIPHPKKDLGKGLVAKIRKQAGV
jgi:hypothetical protein